MQNNAPPELGWPRVFNSAEDIAARGEVESARRDDLHAYMTHADAPRTKQPSEVTWADKDKASLLPVTPRNRRFDYTGSRRMRPVRRPKRDQAHEQLGAEYFDDPVLESAPIADDLGGPGELHGIGDLAKALHRSSRTMRDWESRGILPKAAHRTEGKAHRGVNGDTTSSRRMYTTAEINAAAEIAHDEGLLLGKGQMVDIGKSEFATRVLSAWTRLRESGLTPRSPAG